MPEKEDCYFYEPTVFDNNPKIAKDPKDGERVVVINNHPGKRPYFHGVDSVKFHWNLDYKVEPGEIFLTPQELEVGRKAQGKILIEPNVKDSAMSKNKLWPHWAKFIKLAKEAGIYDRMAQMEGSDRLTLAPRIKTKDFRVALQMVANCDLVVTTDGALHHACAALGVPCVTLWGGLISPAILGYDSQTNIWHGAEPCGSVKTCSHCAEAMNAITPEEVLSATLDAAGRIREVHHDAPNAPSGGAEASIHTECV